MPADRADDRQSERDETQEHTGWLGGVGRFFRLISYLVGLPVITLLGSLLVGYYQYLNAYQEKVNARAEADVRLATDAFTDISKKFAEAQTLQQTMFQDFLNAFDDGTGAEEQALATRHAKNVWEAYEASGLALLQAGDMMARNAEIYVDWATDAGRDPAKPRPPNGDPLSRLLLAAYDFDCSSILPAFLPGNAARPRPESTCHVDPNQYFDPNDLSDNLCPRQRSKGDERSSVTIHWYSAKHQVLTMHYCFDVLHRRLAKVRAWASQGEPTPAIKLAARNERDELRRDIDTQAARLDAFTGLALHQIEVIRVKYRPVSFACHLPFVTPLVSSGNDACTPVQTRPFRPDKQEKQSDKQPKT
jgi:hypothetical protein